MVPTVGARPLLLLDRALGVSGRHGGGLVSDEKAFEVVLLMVKRFGLGMSY